MAGNVTARMSHTTRARTFTGAPTLADWTVIALVVLALGAGWLLRSSAINRMTAFSGQGVTLQYPAGWLPVPSDVSGVVLNVTGGESSAPFQPTLTVRAEQPSPEAAAAGLDGVQLRRGVVQSRALPAFRPLGSTPTTIGNQNALLNEYAYLYDPSNNPLSSVSVPAVVRAQELLVLDGATLYSVTFATAAEDWEQMQPDWNRIIASMSLGGATR